MGRSGVLTESKDAQAYWRKLKQRLKAEGNETVTNCNALKMRALRPGSVSGVQNPPRTCLQLKEEELLT